MPDTDPAARARGPWTTPTVEQPPRRPPTYCRCGHRDDSQLGTRPDPRPIADLRDNTGVRVTTETRRPARLHECASCAHTVGDNHVRASALPSLTHHDYYHQACVVSDPLTIMAGDVVVVTYSTADGGVAVGRTLVLATHYPTDARPQARLAAPTDLADAHRDPASMSTYRVYADTIGRVTDPAIIAAVKENQPA